MNVGDSAVRRWIRLLEALSDGVGRGICWLTLGMVLVTFLVVLLRYAFDLGWIAMQESVTYMHGLVFMLGAAYTLRHNGHVRVDIFYRKLGVRGRLWVDLLGALVLLIPTCVFIAWMSWDYVSVSWEVHEGSREAGGLPGVFLLKTLLLVMPLLLLVQAVAGVVRDLLLLTVGNGWEEEQPEGEL